MLSIPLSHTYYINNYSEVRHRLLNRMPLPLLIRPRLPVRMRKIESWTRFLSFCQTVFSTFVFFQHLKNVSVEGLTTMKLVIQVVGITMEFKMELLEFLELLEVLKLNEIDSGIGIGCTSKF